MGGAIEALTVAVGQSGAVTALAAGIALWLRNRKPQERGKVTVSIEFPDGARVIVRADSVEDPAAVVAAAVEPWIQED